MPTHRLALAASLSLLSGLVSAQTAVRIVAVPARLFLPAAEGANLLLEVECTTPPDSIWLATEELARDSVPLQEAGNGRYQLNLADRRIAALLPFGQRSGELFVFARAGGKVTRSTPVAWMRRISAPALHCQLRTKNGTTALAHAPGLPTWIDPEQIEAVEILGQPAGDGTMVLRSGSFETKLEQTTTPPGFRMSIAQIPEQSLELGAFEIHVAGRTSGYNTWPFRFRLVPRSLDLPRGRMELRVQQRDTAEIPGSRQWLRVKIDDVTGGRVDTTIQSADGRTVAARRGMFERDSVTFRLADAQYVLELDRLVNQLIGDDHAEFSVQAAVGFVPDRIAQLLRAIEASQDTFLRDDEEVDGATAMQSLLLVVSGKNGRKVTLDRFVDELASKSSETGKAHRVKRVDGTEVTMQQWLRDELQRLEAAEAKAGKGSGKGPAEQPPARGTR